MTATEKKERTGKPITVLPRGTISGNKEPKQLTLDDSGFQIKQGKNGEFNFTLSPGSAVIPLRQQPRSNLKPAKKPRAVKGTSDYLDFDQAMRIANDILWHGRQPQVGFYVIFSINTGLRVGDVLKLKHADMIGKQIGDHLIIEEQKTGKRRQVQLNANVIEAYAYLLKRSRTKPANFIFISQKNHVFATVTINRTLKRIFKGCAPVVSSHSLRKTFGRRVYDMNGRSEHSLVLLSDIFGHSNLAITRRYLGLRKQEIIDTYMKL